MLIELRIENLLLIERAELALGSGLNTITGETGAGKTVLAHAIDLLLGGKSRKGIVRPGAAEAYVEGLFAVPPGLLERPELKDLRERLPDPEATELALARRVTPEGRTRAYIEGRSATAPDLQVLGGLLVAFYGQHEHRKLTLASAQLSALDSFAAASTSPHAQRLERLAALYSEATSLGHGLAELELLDGRRERELGLIEFELAEIDELAPDVHEEHDLSAEREKLRAVDRLRLSAESALATVDGAESADGAQLGASELLASAVAALQDAGGADPELDQLTSRASAVMIELQDIAGDIRAYGQSLSADPERLAFLDDRLDGYERLKRKHGGSVESILLHAERCREDQKRLSGSQDQIELAQERLSAIRAEQSELAKKVSKARRAAAPKLAAAVRERLAKLALQDASFEIVIESIAGAPRPTGSDSVEFMIAPNPGIKPMPLRETASGGELSRVMLALLTATAASGPDAQKTFVFDEIDAGIGGHTARAVGELLGSLGVARQVICITHLPQVAAAAETHFRIEKASEQGSARTTVTRLEDDEVIGELCRMMGAESDDAGARKHARALLGAA